MWASKINLYYFTFFTMNFYVENVYLEIHGKSCYNRPGHLIVCLLNKHDLQISINLCCQFFNKGTGSFVVLFTQPPVFELFHHF